jgi:membrane protease subunit (stomatin/prohibitin family)
MSGCNPKRAEKMPEHREPSGRGLRYRNRSADANGGGAVSVLEAAFPVRVESKPSAVAPTPVTSPVLSTSPGASTMGLLDKLRQELIDIIEWVDDSRHTLAWRFPRYQNEIKNGAQLIVRPGQVAVFVHRGELADAFEPGNYKLTTDNLPILSTIMGWKYGFNSPFRSEVYFVSTRQITDLKWGTPNPIMLRDADFGPVRLRAFGTYSMRARDPKALLKELIGTDSSFEADEISELIRSIIITAFADMLGEAKVAALDLAANYKDFSEKLRQEVIERVDDEYGLDIPQLNIVNISLPEEVEKALDTRSSMGAIGDMNKFQQYQMGKAMVDAANNPSGGGMAEGMGLGMGWAMANRMAQAPGMTGGAAPPPPPQAVWHIAVGGQSQGPFTDQQLVQGIQQGEVKPTTQVWTPALGGWTQAGQVPQLAGYFAASSPPPPPPK